MDKFAIANIALNNQIPTPETRIYSCAKEIEQDMRAMCLPLVLKPRFAYYWRQNGVWAKVGARKAVFVESLQQLCQECQQLKSVPGEILVQEFIRGVDSDIVVFCCYVGQDGQLLAYFTARKLRQCPPLFGTGSVVELADVPSIISPSLKLLGVCGYRGLAEIEFKYDRARDQFFFIEINPRHWDQHELGNRVGVNLSWVAYQDMVGLSQERQFPSRLSPNSKWIAERELALSLIGSTYRKVIALRRSKNPLQYFAIVSGTFAELVHILRGPKIFSILRLSDPVPGILMCFRLMRELSKTIWVLTVNFLSTDRRAV
jgi:predicted ATP-grasp superfamily ATP-dependent carboligase